MGQEGRALHEKDRERRHRDVRHRIGGILPPTAVWEALEALAKTAQQGAQALHLHVASYWVGVSQSPQPRRGGFFPSVAIPTRRSPSQPRLEAARLASSSHCKCDSSALRTAGHPHDLPPSGGKPGYSSDGCAMTAGS